MKKDRPDADKLANELLGASAFFRPPAKTPSSPEPPNDAEVPADQPTSSLERTSDVMTSRRHSVTTSASISPAAEPAGFDINRPTASRDSLRLSIDETKALDDLRQSLKWDYDVTVSKNDICRAALHMLLEDWKSRGERSAAMSRLKRKRQY